MCHFFRFGGKPRRAEVDEFAGLLHRIPHHIFGFEVAIDNLAGQSVNVMQRVADFDADRDNCIRWKRLIVVSRAPIVENAAQTLALHQFHHEEQIGVAHNEFVAARDFVVVDLCQDFRLAVKQLALIFKVFGSTRTCVGELLDDDEIAVDVARAKDGSIGARADDFNHLIRVIRALKLFAGFNEHFFGVRP